MREFHYAAIREQKWDSEILSLIAAIYKEAGKQEMYLKQRPEELEKLVEIAKIQSTEASNAIEGIGHDNRSFSFSVIDWQKANGAKMQPSRRFLASAGAFASF